MTFQAVDDGAVHFGKLLGSESVDPSLDLPPWRAVVPGGSVFDREGISNGGGNMT